VYDVKILLGKSGGFHGSTGGYLGNGGHLQSKVPCSQYIY
jgi:hypothetical protein